MPAYLMEKTSETIVISLGGNALGYEPANQIENLKKAIIPITDLIEDGHKVMISHGNGPQVGLILKAFENANVDMPLAECGAMSQGYIGYELKQVLDNELKKRGLEKQSVCIVTQTLVDEDDEGFFEQNKPIGRFYTKDEAEKLSLKTGFTYKDDAGRGYRRHVCSPRPRRIIEEQAIRKLMDEFIVICAGGGGVPVIEKDGALQGIDAVIDKDLCSALLAQSIGADKLVILMKEDNVFYHFGKADEEKLGRVSASKMYQYLEEGEFAKGSMYPKVEACLNFVRDGKQAIITSPELLKEALKGKAGTIITI